MDYDERVLPSIGNEVLKSIVAQFDAAELITQREVVSAISHFTCGQSQRKIPGLLTHQGRPTSARGRVQYQT